MMRRVRGSHRWAILFAAPLVLAAIACEDGSRGNGNGTGQATNPDGSPWVGPVVRGTPPQFTAEVSNVKVAWKDWQQTFDLTMTNEGKKTETVHAVIFASNEDMQPPRRAVSPPTAYLWFKLAGSSDGQLTHKSLERCWKNNAFVGARGGKLPATWVATLAPGASQKTEASHVLDETSPHPATKGKTLKREGFTTYHVWLFTPEGWCFDQKTLSVAELQAADKGPKTKPSEKDPPEAKSDDPEAQAEKALKLATYYLDTNQPAQAREKLQMILDKFPKTASAKTARKMLRDLSN
ncbi:MAG: hypothetical protein K2R98_22645 [Gemmataceae bacterium]|nr:hypothetical protein [Gemmataceae bacterium]